MDAAAGLILVDRPLLIRSSRPARETAIDDVPPPYGHGIDRATHSSQDGSVEHALRGPVLRGNNFFVRSAA